MYHRQDLKLIVLWSLLLIQLLMVVFYLMTAPSNFEPSTPTPAVQFILPPKNKFRKHPESKNIHNRFLTLADTPIFLGASNSQNHFKKTNETICFKGGFSSVIEGRCMCSRGWHGPDCGQPEVVWRALVAARPTLPTPIRRTEPRRLVYILSTTEPDNSIAEIAVGEVATVAELIVVLASNGWKERKGHLPVVLLGARVLVLSSDSEWRNTVADLHPDDIVVSGGGDIIPSAHTLQFLKLYDGWPQPVFFRMRWNIYGFFWLHPERTQTKPGANLAAGGGRGQPFVIGDLNHCGGWLCTLCSAPNSLIDGLSNVEPVLGKLPPIVNSQIIQEAIGAGVSLDERIQLIPTSRIHDPEYAPPFALNNSEYFDLLLTNSYKQSDY